WAPNARKVEFWVDGASTAGSAEGAGWWKGPPATTGMRYGISIDGEPPIPDPRSPWQPDGVNGASCWVDPSELGPIPTGPATTAPPVPLRDAVLYELHVGTFTEGGTFEAAIAHLDDLVALGVTHVELMPIAQFSGVHGWGYDGVDLFAPHASYGGPRGLAELIRQCKHRGLAVIVDCVLNHFGPEGAYVSKLGPY